MCSISGSESVPGASSGKGSEPGGRTGAARRRSRAQVGRGIARPAPTAAAVPRKLLRERRRFMNEVSPISADLAIANSGVFEPSAVLSHELRLDATRDAPALVAADEVVVVVAADGHVERLSVRLR